VLRQRRILACIRASALTAAVPFGVVAAAPPLSTAPPAGASAGAAQHFNVQEYRVLGNTVLPNRAIEGVLYPRLGDSKTIDDVQAARGALEQAYHQAGFASVFVDVPPQEVSEGVIRLRVTEGRLRVRTIGGARYFSEGKILEALPATAPGQVPNLPDLQRELNAVNTQTADRTVVPILKAGPDPGTMDVALKVDDHLPLHGGLDFNNQYTPDTRPLRATASLSYNDMFGELDTLSGQYTWAPQQAGEVGVLNANYGFHTLDDGIRPSLSFINSSSNVATVGTLGVLGDGQVYMSRLSVPVSNSAAGLQTLTFGLDYKHFRNTISLSNAPAQIQPVSYVNASLSYAGAWQKQTQSGSGPQSGSFDLTLDAGPRGPANENADFATSRYQAQGNYIYLRTDGAFTARLPANMLLILRGAGQLALDPLVVYEQQSIAGADGVRGYLEAEALGDRILKGTVQLQSPPLIVRQTNWGDLYLFYDAGQAHHLEALAGEPSRTTLRSWGAGFDLLPGHSVAGYLTWAVPLLPGPNTAAHDSRVLFDLRGSF
jgi:hemolysin activation/secretion protein